MLKERPLLKEACVEMTQEDGAETWKARQVKKVVSLSQHQSVCVSLKKRASVDGSDEGSVNIYTANILKPFFYCEEKHKVQNNPTQNTQLNDLPQSEQSSD